MQRRRILAEVKDHLQRAVENQMQEGIDPLEAQKAAISQFGDPASIASRFSGAESPTQTQTRSGRRQGGSKQLSASQAKGAISHSGKLLFRRYPALSLVAVAAALAFLLPSALNVPQSESVTLAEYAPVPGKGVGESQLSDLSQAQSGELGFGSGTGEGSGPGAGSDSLGAPGQKKPKLKRCVGNPRRQTEDPMSPACVAYFEGDNFGATSRGVTRDEVRVAVLDWCNSDGSFDAIDYDTAESDPNDPRKAWLSYFNDRYQTYGRRVKLFKVVGSPTNGVSCFSGNVNAARNVPQRLQEVVDPFYAFSGRSSELTEQFATEAARLEIMVSLWGGSRSVAQRHAPYIVSYPADLENWAANVVAASCARLAGRRARFAGDIALSTKVRKFGLLYNRPADPQREGVRLVVHGVKERCGSEAGEIVVAGDMAKFRDEGVTTIMTGLNGGPNNAEIAGYHPEWFAWEHTRHIRTSQIEPASQMKNMFGLLPDRRYGARSEQPHRQAFQEGCPGCTPSETIYSGVDGYHELLLLFTAIQAAGPRLTPESSDRGLRALPPKRSLDPFTQSAYFGPGNHSFVKDYGFAWWDPAGEAPGGTGLGCWRLVEDGLRYRAEDWAARPGDEGIQGSAQPCQGEPNG